MALSKFYKDELSTEEARQLCIGSLTPLKKYPTVEEFPDISTKMTTQEKFNYLRDFNKTPHCTDVSKYQCIKKIGSGTFGDVYMAHNIAEPSKIVAIKKIKFINDKNEGFPMTALREIDILQQLKHDNIVKLIEVCRSSSINGASIIFTYCLILEYCEHDLGGVLVNQMIDLSDAERKNLIQQLLTGVQFMHKKNILHRDIKSANLLLNKDGYLKLADMGLARIIDKPPDPIGTKTFTNCVVTLWYRAPELLLGDQSYGSGVDMWSVGLIMCEIWLREPFLPGNSEMEQLNLIVKLCGSITPNSCPSAKTYPYYARVSLPSSFPRNVLARLKGKVKDSLCLDLIDFLLQLEPSRRMSASFALSHKYFRTLPRLSNLRSLMTRIRGNYYSR